MADDVKTALTQAAAFHRTGRLADAEKGYLAILTVAPDHSEAVRLLGSLYLQQGRAGEAVARLRTFLAHNSGGAQIHNVLGVALLESGDSEGALAAFRQACALEPGNVVAQYNLGHTLQLTGKHDAAAEAFTRALELQPALAQAHAGLAISAEAMGDAGRAEAAFRDSLKHAPGDAVTLNNFASFLSSRDRVDEALEIARRSAAAAPSLPAVHITLGNCLRRANLPEDAAAAYRRALALDSKQLEARINLAHLLRERGKWVEAAEVYQRAVRDGWPVANLRSIPCRSRAESHYLGLLQLKLGDLAAGWKNFEYRTFSGEGDERTGLTRYPPPPPYWQGEDLVGKHIFVWREQGLGDQILFGSMLNDLIARAGRVTFDSKPRLKRVFERSFPGAFIVDGGTDQDKVQSPERYDYQIGLGSLGKYLRRDFGAFPSHDRFLAPDPDKAGRIRNRYRTLAKDRKIVGVAWRSQHEKLAQAKSADIGDWRELLTAPNAWFVNLQYGARTEELAALKSGIGVDVFDDPDIDPMADLDDVFAQVAAVDLVISTSNTVVHVAGSLGVPCWLLLPQGKGALWYWFTDRGDSPWYPSLRIYREARASDDLPTADYWWRGPVERAAADLRAYGRDRN